ncbi:MAG: hypothetical protein RI897_335 [Verrucomicrobiota bacterium]|jgi:tRNA U34 5-methylaminomethyl-2-thiouridine-forming methyltransferase MnmC
MTGGEYRLVQLANGTWSVRSDRYAETFHPVVGPAEEANTLYVRQPRLRERMSSTPEPFVIWDVGLGAAGNPLAVLAATNDLPGQTQIFSFDQTTEPLTFALQHESAFPHLPEYKTCLHQLLTPPIHHSIFTDNQRHVEWQLHVGDFPSWLTSPDAPTLPKPHAILFDAYSPASNPEMWTLPLFEKLFRLLDPARPCALPTYSRSTLLRVTLLLAGFYVGAGHATGEKDETTLAANTPDLIEELLDHNWLGRVQRSTSAEPLRSNHYLQAPLSQESRDRLERHPQFARP